jgi:predicted ATP-grasp superfamily ATP-dependent carboligase
LSDYSDTLLGQRVRLSRPDLLLIGASARALAASVRHSGFRGSLVALDLFGDRDLERLCRCLVPGRELRGERSTAALLRAAAALRPRAVAFAGGMETHPALLSRLEKRAFILGNSARAVRAVRGPERFFALLDREGIPHPRTWARAGIGPRPVGAGSRLLWKPRCGGGGLRIRQLRQAALERALSGYVQERVRGVPGSVAFVADGRRCRILGYCRMLSGEPGLGASGFTYCGNLWGPAEEWLPAEAARVVARAAALVTARFGLRGLNGLDFILERDRPLILELNPRYTGSMELIEEGSGLRLFALHRNACMAGKLPEPFGEEWEGVPARGWLGKGIVYATSDFEVASAAPFEALRARDVPRPGTQVRAGSPLCTLVAKGCSAEECRRNLLEGAARLRRALALRRRRAANPGQAAGLLTRAADAPH